MIQRPPVSPEIALRRRLGCSLGQPRNPAAIDRPRTEEAVEPLHRRTSRDEGAVKGLDRYAAQSALDSPFVPRKERRSGSTANQVRHPISAQRFRQLVIRLTDAEHTAFEAGARAAGLSMAVFARAQLAPHTRRKDAP